MTSTSPIPGIDWQAGLKRLMNNEALFKKLLLSFLNDYATAMESIRKACATDRDDACHQLHTLKGVAGNLSMTGLYEASIAAENAIRAGQDEDARLDAAEKELNELIGHLQAFLK